MRIAYLQYNRGFSIVDFYRLLYSNPNLTVSNLESTSEMILKKLADLKIEKIYISFLDINPKELSQISETLLYEIPIRLNKNIDIGFTDEMIYWIKNHVLISENIAQQQLYYYDKLKLSGIELTLFEADKQQNFLVGREQSEHIDQQMVKIEVSIDDMNPEFYGYQTEQLFDIGANDVYIEQVIMKKNRPAQVLNILCQEEIKDRIVSFLFKETTTLGIRYTPYTVHRLEREFISVNTEWGKTKIKVGRYRGEVVQFAPEYEQCVDIAKKYKLPLKFVYDTVKEKGYQWLQNNLKLK